MGIGKKFSGWIKSRWESATTAPAQEPLAHHRAGFGPLYNMLTGNNLPAAYEQKHPAPRQD